MPALMWANTTLAAGCVPAADTFPPVFTMERVCIFVDGENFRHSIRGLFSEFNPNDYLPKRADWTQFFDWIANRLSASPHRVRTYWYVVRHLEFFPYRLNRLQHDSIKLRKILSKDASLKTTLDGIGDDVTRNRKMDAMVADLEAQKDRIQRRFDGWTAIQSGISTAHKAIEFRSAGSINCNLLENSKFGSEKAVDVKLATDLITLKDIYDIAAIVSGDQDYVPAVQVIKDSGKRVVNVAFETRNGRLLPGGARRLNQATDWSLPVGYSEMADFLHVER